MDQIRNRDEMVGAEEIKPTAKGRRRNAILDAAEKLFAQSGYDGVTIRAIAKEAGVDVALPNYYFGPKLSLFEATFQRRAELLNQWRLEALNLCISDAAPNPPSVRAIVEAYLHPLLMREHVHEPGWRNYYALVAYVNSSAEWGRRLMSNTYNPTIDRFMTSLKSARPGVSEEALYWGYHCLSGALSLAFARTGRLDELSSGTANSNDFEKGYKHMVNFVTAGFEAL
jgi:AcrR family transcriptional regulator